MNYLALDYGEHRVGVAFADSELKFAFARETIDQKVTNLWVRLDELVKVNKVDAFVVGMLSMLSCRWHCLDQTIPR